MEELIRVNKPKISASSIKAYLSILHSLNRAMKNEDEDTTVIFNDPASVINFIEQYKLKRRKSILSPLIILTTHDEKVAEVYRNELYKVSKEYDALQLEEKKMDTNKANWITWPDVLNVYEEMTQDIAPLLKRKVKTDMDVQRLQEYVLLSLYVLIKPRGSKDYVDFVIKDVNKEKDNYFDAKEKLLVFNSYANAKTYGTQYINAPPKLVSILNKWLSINPSDHLFFGLLGKPIQHPQITQWLTKIFGSNVSVVMLRHAYLTHFNSLKKSLKSMDDTAITK